MWIERESAMAKKKKTKRKPVYVDITPQEYLETKIRLTERSINNQDNSVNEFLRHQAIKLKKELAELRAK